MENNKCSFSDTQLEVFKASQLYFARGILNPHKDTKYEFQFYDYTISPRAISAYLEDTFIEIYYQISEGMGEEIF